MMARIATMARMPVNGPISSPAPSRRATAAAAHRGEEDQVVLTPPAITTPKTSQMIPGR